MNRIVQKFSELEKANQKAFIAYIMAGDPSYETSAEILKNLPQAGVDIIELGVPFSDPMADGPTIQQAGERAIKAGMTLKKVLKMAQEFRIHDKKTPIVLMGYYNPIYIFGVNLFLEKAKKAGIDGLIIVDLPPEEDDELCLPAHTAGIDFIRLATPTTDDRRLVKVLQNSSGFIYYVSIAGITGTKGANADNIAPDVTRIKRAGKLPVVVGFGIKTPDDVASISKIADGVVVGSAIVDKIGAGESVETILTYVQTLSKSAHKK